MLIIGAGGHAVEILNILIGTGYSEEIFFFDNVTSGMPKLIFDKHLILKSTKEIEEYFRSSSQFLLGVGGCKLRKKLAELATKAGGKLESIIATTAEIGNQVTLGAGINIMNGAIVTERIYIGEGTLIHVHSSIHHDCRLGNYCEVSPGARLLGRVTLGDGVSIGAGAVVLPNVKIGSRSIVGAGAVVTKDVEEGVTVAGVPAKVIAQNKQDK